MKALFKNKSIDQMKKDFKHKRDDIKNYLCMKKETNPLTGVIFAKPIFPNAISKLLKTTKLEKDERAFVKSVVEKHHDFVLSHLNEKEREQLVRAMEKLEVEEGFRIIDQDDAADFLYVLAKGSVRFVKDGEEIGTTSNPGDIFGELALLYDTPREASVVATSSCVLYRVARETFRTIQAHFIVENEKPLKLLKNSKLFHDRSEELLEKLAECVFRREFSEGDVLMRKGEPVDVIWFIKDGRVLVQDVSIRDKQVADTILLPGEAIGDWCIVMDEPAAYNLVCQSDVVVYALTKERFLKCTEGMDLHELIERPSDVKVLLSAPFMRDSDICRAELTLLTKKLERITLEPGEVLATIGEEVETAVYWMSTKNKDDAYVELVQRDGSIRKWRTNQIWSYGRMAFIVKNLADVDINKAIAYSKQNNLLHWDTEEGIADLLRSLKDRSSCTAQFTTRAPLEGTGPIHIRKLTNKAMRDVVHDMSRFGQQYKTKYLRQEARETLAHEKLEKKRLLGQGSFGQVWLCREPTRDAAYALKIQYKRELIISYQAKGVVREAAIMRRMHHPFVTDLVHAEQDPTSLYMVMELFPGGELRSLMRNDRKNHMAEEETKFYAACILEGLSYMHRREYVYRDLKGENVLLDKDGYCVIVDLGFAKHVPRKTFTFCGTPIFISPEVLLNKGHDKSADIWALGIMIFEMLFGTNPFFDYDDKRITQVKLFKRIVKGKFQTPVKKYAIDAYSNTSKEAKDLIRRLLESNPDKRLGCLPGEDLDIRRHPWFAGYDWGKLYRKELKAPWVPQLSDPFDGKNFNEVKLRKNNGLRPLEETEQELFESFC